MFGKNRDEKKWRMGLIHCLVIVMSYAMMAGFTLEPWEINAKENGEKAEVFKISYGGVPAPESPREWYVNLYLDASFYESKDMIYDSGEKDLRDVEAEGRIEVVEDEIPQGRATFKGEGVWPVVIDTDEEMVSNLHFKTKRKAVITGASGGELFLKPLFVLLGVLLFLLVIVNVLLKKYRKYRNT